MLMWMLAAVVLGGVVMVGQSSVLMGSAPAGPERVMAEPNQVAVIDGDTLRLGGRVVRLAGIEAPGRGDACPGGTGGGTDCGSAATTVLAGLVRDRRLDCRLSGRDAMGRSFAACDANGQDLSSAVVSSGWARVQGDSAVLAGLEAQARRQGAGLWRR